MLFFFLVKIPTHVELSIKYLSVLVFILQTLNYLSRPCIAVQITVCFGLSEFLFWLF